MLAFGAIWLLRCSGNTSPDHRDTGTDANVSDAPDDAHCECSAMNALSCYCQELWCPVYEAAKECSGARISIRTGCGHEWVQRGHPKWGYGYGIYAFDAISHELVGVKSENESPVGPCKKTAYQTDGFIDPCSAATECILCGPTYDEIPPCADAGTPDGSTDVDASAVCKGLDEEACLSAAGPGKCTALHGAKVPGGTKQFVACRSECMGGAVVSCGIDPAGSCWVFPDTCVPEGWTSVFECNPDGAPACVGALDAGWAG